MGWKIDENISDKFDKALHCEGLYNKHKPTLFKEAENAF